MVQVRNGRRLFDIFTKVVIAFAFLGLALSFLDVAFGIDIVGLNATFEDFTTWGALAAFAVVLNLAGKGLYTLIERPSKSVGKLGVRYVRFPPKVDIREWPLSTHCGH